MSLETPESVVGKPGSRIFGKAKCSDDPLILFTEKCCLCSRITEEKKWKTKRKTRK